VCLCRVALIWQDQTWPCQRLTPPSSVHATQWDSACCTAVPHDSPPQSDIQKQYFWPYSCCRFVNIDTRVRTHAHTLLHNN
jgi:hypothetical protein